MAVEDVLNNIQPQEGPQVNVDDVNNYTPSDFTPEMQDAYQEYQNMNPPTRGVLPENVYYPGGVNNPTAVGSYSGSLIGSTTLFAPGSAMVPLGMLDARDVAVKKAALQKQKEVEDFKKKFNAPTSKLTNINQKLTEKYFGFVDNSWKDAMKKTGNDANKAAYLLKNDPNFAAKEKSYQDLAKYGDAIVNKTAQDEEEIKSGKFLPTPSYKALKQKLYTALDPTSNEFKDLGATYNQMQLEREFSNAFNEVTAKMVQSQTGSAGADMSDPEFAKVYESTVKSWDQSQKDAVVKALSENIYGGSDYFTPDKIKKDVYGMMSGQIVDKNLKLNAKRDDGGMSEQFTEENDAKEPSLTNVAFQVKAGTGVNKSDYSNEQVAGHFGQTLKKPIPVQIASGTRMYSIGQDGKMFLDTKSQGVRDVKIGKAENVQVIDAPGTLDDGRVVTPQYIKRNPNVKTKFEPFAKGSYEKDLLATEEDVKSGAAEKVGEPIRNSSGTPLKETVSAYIPLSEVENGVQKKSNGKYVGGINVDLLKKRSEELNSGKVKAPEISVQKSSSGENVAVKGGEKTTKARKYKGLDAKGNPIFGE